MGRTGKNPSKQPVAKLTEISSNTKYRARRGTRAALGALSVALLLLNACLSGPPLPDRKVTPAPQVSAPSPAPLAQERDRRYDGFGALRSESFSSLPSYYPRPPIIPPSTDRFPDKDPTGVLSVAEHPVSTFSVDVDTASYAFVRRNLVGGRLPPREAVRVEEMINYFRYAYPAPQDRAQPFRVSTSVMPSPWSADNRLLHIAIRGYDIARAERPRANIVLLIDTSGSMQPSDRLPLLQQGFRLFAQQLRDDDRVAIVTYAGQAQTALEPTTGKDKHKIIEVIDNLRASGSTAGGEGMRRAYALAERHFDKQAVNRVILATDGDFNVGITDPKELERFIAEKRKTSWAGSITFEWATRGGRLIRNLSVDLRRWHRQS